MDLFEKCLSFTDVEDARKLGLYPYFHTLQSKQDVEVVMEGKRRIMLGSNNYLGLTVRREVIEAAREALTRYGTGCSGSRFLNGTLELHITLEDELAEFVRKEAAVTFSTGFQTNLGIISALVGRGDYVICDRENHASIYDACKLSYGKMLRYAHGDMDGLRGILERLPEDAGKLVVTDGVFSMSGDIADLPSIVRLARAHGARVMVDDAHSFGVLGDGGRGTADYFGLTDEVDIIMSTFSKSLASLGGFMAADQKVIEYVRHKSRPFIFSASIPPPNCAAALAALRVLRREPELPKRLLELSSYARKAFTDRGIKVRASMTPDAVTPVIPLYTYDTLTTLTVGKELFEEGVYVNPVLPPATPETECLLRCTCMASHTEALIDEAADIISTVMKRHDL